VSAGFVGTAV